MILSNEWIKDSIETYLYQRRTKSQIIYWVVLIAISIAIILLPFIYVDVSVRATGTIRPISEKSEVISSVSELIDSIYVHEGDKIKKGDVLLQFRTNNSDYKIDYQSNKVKDLQAHIADLSLLIKGSKPISFHSSVRSQEYVYYTKRLTELSTQMEHSKREYYRNKKLFDNQLISEEEYLKYYYEYENNKNSLDSYKENQLSTWQVDLNTSRNSLSEMYSLLNETVKSKDLYTVKSPINGTIDHFSGIYIGSSVQIGQTIAIISPDSTMYLESYVEPRNIGYIQMGMPVQIQVESFNYNEWGSLTGKVISISSDFLIDGNGKSYYKVKCSMNKDYLQLKNGRKGFLKKGMSANAHFMITRKSLFDLLYQKMDNWVNPTQYKSENDL